MTQPRRTYQAAGQSLDRALQSLWGDPACGKAGLELGVVALELAPRQKPRLLSRTRSRKTPKVHHASSRGREHDARHTHSGQVTASTVIDELGEVGWLWTTPCKISHFRRAGVPSGYPRRFEWYRMLRRIGSVLIAVGALLLGLLLLLSAGTDVVFFALNLLGFNDVLISYNPVVIAGLAATAVLLGIVMLQLPHKKTTASRL
jgi:hypothetical protein